MAATFVSNFLTDNSLNMVDASALREAGEDVDDLVEVADEVLVSSVPGAWSRLQFETDPSADHILTSKNLAAELQFLNDLGAAIPLPDADPGTWLLHRGFRDDLYNDASGVFVAPLEGELTVAEKRERENRLARLFRNYTLPAYIRASAAVVPGLPDTVHEAHYLKQMSVLFDKLTRDLRDAFPEDR
jgi:hypothetical protein